METTPSECIYRHCLQCKGDEWAVGNCMKMDCSLHPVRPNQGLMGKKRTDYEFTQIEQQILDNLDFKGLKEMLQ